MNNRELDDLFSADGLVHTAYIGRECHIYGRRDLWSDDTYKDAWVCLTCTAEMCDGDTKCFRRRKLGAENLPELPPDILLEDLIYADEVCESGTWYDVPDKI